MPLNVNLKKETMEQREGDWLTRGRRPDQHRPHSSARFQVSEIVIKRGGGGGHLGLAKSYKHPLWAKRY